MGGALSLAGAAAAAGLIIACHRAGASAGEVAGALAALALALGHGRDLGAVRDRWQAAEAARGRLEALLAAPALRGPCRAAPLSGKPALRFAAVSAGPVRDFSATLGAGGKAVLVGPAGSGKSALLRVAAGLAPPAQGKARVFGADPQRLAPRNLGRTVLYLGPEPPLLAGSLRRALCLGLRRRPDDATLRATAERAGLGPLLDRLGGLDGRLAESGRTLSHGERALIALARLALAPQALALIDGIDAHLDPEARARLADEIARRPGAVLCVLRHPVTALAALPRWTLPGHNPDDGEPAQCRL
jgi:ABC-type transport system involved in cytochrome bd biosynthesis fused ATPase/permease subunit